MPLLEPIDRDAPTRLPAGFSVMRQRWADLLFLHWPVPVEILRPLVPAPLEVDTFEGRAFVGLVPFTMTGVRPVGFPAVRWLSNFHEVNVRAYVHLQGRDPGVWFFSLDAASAPAVRIARRLWHLAYHFARMSLETHENGRVSYRSERLWPEPTPASCDLEYQPTGNPRESLLGTLEHFLTERYVLYAKRGTKLYLGRVHHTPYPLQTAELSRLDESLLLASGILRPEAPPLAHYASEVRVKIFPIRRIRLDQSSR
jgi:uncharacterized protein YqjF (DUF2071 family)